MKCIVLVGGYATRMYPITLNIPKALLKYKTTTVLDNIIDNITSNCKQIDEIILVTNDTFYNDFKNWKEKKLENIKLISDGSTTNENKIGALSALIKTLNELNINDDCFITAGDNLIDFKLNYIFEEFSSNNYSCIMYYIEKNIEKLRKTGVIKKDINNFISDMEEKPKNPKSNYAVPPFYWLKKKDIVLLLDNFKNDKKYDNLGNIINILYNITNIKAIEMHGNRIDIGEIDEYKKLVSK